MQVRSLGGEDPLEAWQPTPVFLLGKSDGQRSLEGYHPSGHRVRNDWMIKHTQQRRPTSEAAASV